MKWKHNRVSQQNKFRGRVDEEFLTAVALSEFNCQRKYRVGPMTVLAQLNLSSSHLINKFLSNKFRFVVFASLTFSTESHSSVFQDFGPKSFLMLPLKRSWKDLTFREKIETLDGLFQKGQRLFWACDHCTKLQSKGGYRETINIFKTGQPRPFFINFPQNKFQSMTIIVCCKQRAVVMVNRLAELAP